jgi:hypothetical protein
VDGDVDDAGAVGVEDHPPLQGAGGVVEVHDGLLGAAQGLEGALDQLVAGLREHLDRDVVGDQVVLDELPDEVEVGLAGRREADLDLLVAHLDQEFEHPPLAVGRHRVDEGLVAVAEVHRAPARSDGRDLLRPGAVGQHHGGEGGVAMDRHPRGLLRIAYVRVLRGHDEAPLARAGLSSDGAVSRRRERTRSRQITAARGPT